MSQVLYDYDDYDYDYNDNDDTDDAKAIAIPRVIAENSRAKNDKKKKCQGKKKKELVSSVYSVDSFLTKQVLD